MARSFRSRHLAVMAENERQMTALFAGLAAFAVREVSRHADAEGVLPRSATFELQQTIGARVLRAFVGRGRNGDWAPFELLPDGSLFPLSPFMRNLLARVSEATQIAVEAHAALMRRRLRQASDVRLAFERARIDPFAAARRATEQRVFFPNPLAAYDPLHLWIDPNGYRLSDRIWNAADATRRQIDMYLEESIARGRGALQMSRELEQFLSPERQLRRTKTPYGTDASYDAMRLARTEITRAAAQADQMSALMNPFVAGVRNVLSPQHPCCDICDEAAAAGPWPKDAIPAQYQIPLHPHCMCYLAYEMIDGAEQAAILEELRGEIRAAREGLAAMIGPLLVQQFTNLLLRGFTRR